MLCVGLDASGVLVALDPQPLTPDATTCALVVQGYTELGNDVMQITPAQGGQIAVAILTVWAIAFAFRLVIKTLSLGEEASETGA